MSHLLSVTQEQASLTSIQVFHPKEAELLSAFDQNVRVLLPSVISNGAISIMEVEVPPFQGPPPHLHLAEDETFLIKTGRFEFWLDGEKIEVGPGDVVYGPRDVPHTFTNISNEPSVLQVIAVSAGFESFFRQCSEIWQDSDATAKVGEIALAHQLQFLDPALTPKVGAPLNGKTMRVVRRGEGEFLVTPEGQGHVVISEEDTAGDFSCGFMNFPQHGGPQPHIHKQEDEIFIVQEGTFDFSSNDHVLRAESGDVMWLPRDVPHSFRCISKGGGQLLGVFLPGAFTGYFREGAALFAQGNPTLTQIHQLVSKYDITFLTPVA